MEWKSVKINTKFILFGYKISILYPYCHIYSSELNPKAKEEQEAKRREILDSFRNAPFEDIVARSEAKVRMMSVYFCSDRRVISALNDWQVICVKHGSQLNLSYTDTMLYIGKCSQLRNFRSRYESLSGPFIGLFWAAGGWVLYKFCCNCFTIKLQK